MLIRLRRAKFTTADQFDQDRPSLQLIVCAPPEKLIDDHRHAESL